MGTRIRVVVRVRPPKTKKGETCVLNCNARTGTYIGLPADVDPEEKKMPFDSVLGPETTQHDAYLSCGLPLVEALMDGKPACLFAYGQVTGCTQQQLSTHRL